MKLSQLLTHFAAIAAGTVAFCLVLVINLLGRDILEERLMNVGSWVRWPENWPLVVGYVHVDNLFFWGYPACVGLTTTFCFWNGWPRQAARLIVYLLILGIVGPLTYINYHYADQWLNLWVQAIFNIFVAFCGYTVVIKVKNIRAKAADALAIQSLSILTISALLIALPLFYTGIFLSVAFKLMDHTQVKSIGENVPLVVAGGAGAIAVLLANLERLRG